MNPKHIRLAAILGQALYCLAIFAFGIVSGVPFFVTFIGPSALLVLIAFFPRFYYDMVALAAMILLILVSFLFAAAAALFNHEFLLAVAALAIPLSCLAALVYCMDRLKREDASYA
jgi:hypothetical protein